MIPPVSGHSRLAPDVVHQRGAFNQAGAEHGIGEVGAGFSAARRGRKTAPSGCDPAHGAAGKMNHIQCVRLLPAAKIPPKKVDYGCSELR